MKFKLSYIAAAATSMACSFAGAQITTTYGVGASAQINGTAIGTTANAGEQAVAVGGNANAGSQGAVAVGGCTNIVCIENGVVVNRPLPVGTGSTAIGSGAMTPGDQATALGANASATHVNAVALGAGTQTTRDNAVAVGGRQITSVAAGSVGTDAVNVDQFNTGLASTLSDANAYTDRRDAATLNQANSYTDGKTRYFQANSSAAASIATGRDTVSIGPGAIGSGNNAIAGGKGAIAGADDTVGFGAAAQATAAGAVAVGSNANAIGASSAALGNRARAVNANDVALGAGSTTATAVGTRGVMLNGRSYTFAGTAPTSTVSVGTAGSERTITNVAAGRLSGTSTDAVNGSQLNATNTTLSALGDNMNVLGTSTAANLGGGAAYDPKTGLVSAPGHVLNGVSYNSAGGALNAIGSALASTNPDNLPPASATGRNAVAIGSGSVANRDDTISFGKAGAERQLANVAPGTASTDATNLGQVRSMVDRNSREDRAYTDARVNALDAQTRKQMAGVGAMAMAASALVPNARAPGATSVSAAIGTYGGESAIAAGVNHYVSSQLLINARLSATTAGPATVGAAVGMTWGF